MKSSPESPRIAILLPCFNEVLTIAKVVGDFKEQIPESTVYVYDNNSTDGTDEIALKAGAIVRHEKRQGKGFVVNRMLDEIDADVYLMADGDDTYPADRARDMIAPILDGRADMVVGNRLVTYGDHSFRPLHVFGNQLVVRSINVIFGSTVHDVMSGYRAMSHEFVNKIPIISKGFEIETEITLQALYRNFVIEEVPVAYGQRPTGSFSKLHTIRDGFRVLLKIGDIFKAYRPLLFFFLIAGFVALAGLILGSIPILEFIRTGRILHFPTAILAAAIEIVAVILLGCGLILDSTNHHFREVSQLVLKAARGAHSRLENEKPPTR